MISNQYQSGTSNRSNRQLRSLEHSTPNCNPRTSNPTTYNQSLNPTASQGRSFVPTSSALALPPLCRTAQWKCGVTTFSLATRDSMRRYPEFRIWGFRALQGMLIAVRVQVVPSSACRDIGHRALGVLALFRLAVMCSLVLSDLYPHLLAGPREEGFRSVSLNHKP